MPIGKALKSSPPFPPAHTVHATFTAHGVPSFSQTTEGHHSVAHYTQHQHFDLRFSARTNQLIFLRLNARTLRTFHCSICSIHTFMALGPRFDSCNHRCACNTTRTFSYTKDTHPQSQQPFILGFVSDSTSHSDHNHLLDPRHIRSNPFCRLYRASYQTAFAVKHAEAQRPRFRALPLHSTIQTYSKLVKNQNSNQFRKNKINSAIK